MRTYAVNGCPEMNARELKIQRMIRRIRNSDVLFHENEAYADKACELLGRLKDRLNSYWAEYNRWRDARIKAAANKAARLQYEKKVILAKWRRQHRNSTEAERTKAFEDICGGRDRAGRLLEAFSGLSPGSGEKRALEEGFTPGEIAILVELQK